MRNDRCEFGDGSMERMKVKDERFECVDEWLEAVVDGLGMMKMNKKKVKMKSLKVIEGGNENG